MRRLVARLREGGEADLRQHLRGRPSNREADADLRQRVLDAYRSHFHGFGPTLTCEKLAELGLDVGVETLRRWLIAEGLWQPRR